MRSDVERSPSMTRSMSATAGSRNAVARDPYSSGVELTILRPEGSTRCVIDHATIDETVGYEGFASSWASKRA
jgi:hypothetical protein